MPSDRTPADTGPAPGEDAGGAGSVVVGLDPSSPAGITLAKVRPNPELRARLDAFAEDLQRVNESLARVAPAVQRAAQVMGESLRAVREQSYDPRYAPPVRDAMHWTPPADGEETPPCPA